MTAAVCHEGEMKDVLEILLFFHVIYSPGYYGDTTLRPFPGFNPVGESDRKKTDSILKLKKQVTKKHLKK